MLIIQLEYSEYHIVYNILLYYLIINDNKQM